MASRKCVRCQRPRGFSVKGKGWKSDDSHDLCQRCFRDELNRQRAKGMK